MLVNTNLWFVTQTQSRGTIFAVVTEDCCGFVGVSLLDWVTDIRNTLDRLNALIVPLQ